jgi:hypothetical protein
VQQSLREDAPEVRERKPSAAHASRPNPITGRIIARVLLIATAVSAFFSLFGPFDAPVRSIMLRDAQYFVYGWTGSLLGLVSARLAWRLGLWRWGVLGIGLSTGFIMAPAMMLLVWLTTAAIRGAPLPMSDLPDTLWTVLLISLGSSVLTVFVMRGARGAAAVTAPAPPKFLERIPLKLRGGDLWAVEAEDHYLRLHTSKGQDLILMRLADAVDELDGIEGAQVHRSWWVARDAIADARRGDGRATLTLRDGSEVPVSRTYARVLRDRNWI